MIIDYIRMKNYRQYRNVKIDFGILSNKKFIVIVGGMGTGKTNLLNAITWCFYGKEPHIGKKYLGLPIPNTLVLNEMKVGGTNSVEVEIQLSKEDKKYRIKRTLWFVKSQDGTPEISCSGNQQDGTNLEIWADLGKNVGYFKEPSLIIQRLIPEDIHEYFFFDGERLNDYFEEEAGQKIKDAVFKISQLELLDRIIGHLDEAKRGMLKKSKETSPVTQQIIDKIEMFKNSLKTQEENISKLYADKKEGEKNEREISQKLRESKVPNIKELVAEKENIEHKVKRQKEELDEIETEYTKYIVELAPQILGFKPVFQTHTMISKGKEAGEIPPEIKKNFLRKLLEKGKCICGVDISKETEYRQNIKKLLEDCDEITNISDELIRLHISTEVIIDNIKKFPEKYNSYGKKIKQLNNELEENKETIKTIEEKIKGTDVEEIRRLEERLEEYKEKIGNANQNIGMTKRQIETTKEKIKIFEKELEDALSKEKRLKSLQAYCTFCDDALTVANSIKNEIMDETRKSIEERTKRQFLELGWKEKTYRDLRIDDRYNISLKDQSGLPAVGTLSAGERQILALAFIESLNVISGFDAPIVIDTPLARIAEEPTVNIARNLPNYFEGKQVILLVTDKEYNSLVRKDLSKAVFKEYKIKFEETEKGNVAEVVSYGE